MWRHSRALKMSGTINELSVLAAVLKGGQVGIIVKVGSRSILHMAFNGSL